MKKKPKKTKTPSNSPAPAHSADPATNPPPKQPTEPVHAESSDTRPPTFDIQIDVNPIVNTRHDSLYRILKTDDNLFPRDIDVSIHRPS